MYFLLIYVIAHFLNWLNFISKLVQYFLIWFIFFWNQFNFLKLVHFSSNQLNFFKLVHFFSNQFNFFKLVHFFWKTVFFLNWYIKKKKWVVLHISLSPLSPLLITLSFCVPPYPHYLCYLNIFFTQRQITFTSTIFEPLPQL